MILVLYNDGRLVAFQDHGADDMTKMLMPGAKVEYEASLIIRLPLHAKRCAVDAEGYLPGIMVDKNRLGKEFKVKAHDIEQMWNGRK